MIMNENQHNYIMEIENLKYNFSFLTIKIN